MAIVLHEKRINIVVPKADSGLYQLFANYAGTASNAYATYPLSYLEMSRPTGRYVSGIVLRELNLFIRYHSIIMIGNSCAPGDFFPRLEHRKGMEQFEQLRKSKCGVFIANVLGEEEDMENAVVFKSEPFMVLPVRQNWKTLSDYLADMHSKYRIRAKKALEASSKLEMRSFNGETIEPQLLEQCATLLQRTLRKKTIAMNSNLEGILLRFAEHFGTDFHFHLYFLDNELIGFITFCRYGNEIKAWQLGYHAGIARETHIYQRMLLDIIGQGIALGVKKIHMGRTATEIKSTLGAEPVPNQFVVFAKSRVLRFLMRFYKKYYFRPAEYTLRRPFKF